MESADGSPSYHASLSAAASGLLAAGFLPMAVASADIYDAVPDPVTFQPTDAIGYPPLYSEVIGTEDWSAFDVTTGKLLAADQMFGSDTHTAFGSFTNDDFIKHVELGLNAPPVGTQVDLADYGAGFENGWIDVPGGGGGISDLLITPLGDFPLFGTFF
ncbi:MAG: hypothetical protein WCC28_17555 [Mycobacterium sp.]|uniref:hypothetical protein n=1 Tax=Mycobacterium sp. TaxID=1785 RepID=UPI003C710A74